MANDALYRVETAVTFKIFRDGPELLGRIISVVPQLNPDNSGYLIEFISADVEVWPGTYYRLHHEVKLVTFEMGDLVELTHGPRKGMIGAVGSPPQDGKAYSWVCFKIDGKLSFGNWFNWKLKKVR